MRYKYKMISFTAIFAGWKEIIVAVTFCMYTSPMLQQPDTRDYSTIFTTRSNIKYCTKAFGHMFSGIKYHVFCNRDVISNISIGYYY